MIGSHLHEDGAAWENCQISLPSLGQSPNLFCTLSGFSDSSRAGLSSRYRILSSSPSCSLPSVCLLPPFVKLFLSVDILNGKRMGNRFQTVFAPPPLLEKLGCKEGNLDLNSPSLASMRVLLLVSRGAQVPYIKWYNVCI